LPELAEEVLGLPVRRGAPTGIGGLMDVVKSPSYATGVGLVKHGAEQLTGTSAPERTVEVATSRGLSRKIGAWFREVF
jgi:cell division protein FtsA